MALCSTPVKPSEMSFSQLNLSSIYQQGLIPIPEYQKSKSCMLTSGVPKSSTPSRRPLKDALKAFSRLFSRKKSRQQNKTRLAASKIKSKYLTKQVSMRSIEFWEEDYVTLKRRSSSIARTLPI